MVPLPVKEECEVRTLGTIGIIETIGTGNLWELLLFCDTEPGLLNGSLLLLNDP